MSRGTLSLFADDSDEDSINTTTTAESEVDTDKEYAVEKILAEQADAEGVMHYLMKWEGYPLQFSTWERKENFQSDTLLAEWERDKRLATQSGKSPFDLKEFEVAVEHHHDEKEDKKRRRIAKRRRRGEVVPSQDEEESEYEAERTRPESPKRSRVKAEPVKRKGIAHLVAKRRATITALSDGDDDDSDEDSLFGELKDSAPITAPPKRKRESNAAAKPKPQPQKATSAQKPLAGSTLAPHARRDSTSQVSRTSALNGLARTTSASTKPTPSTGAARKSAPSVGDRPSTLAKRTFTSNNVFSGDWTAERKRRSRGRVSGETPKDSADPKFTRLSIQNRYQKYSKNEPAPDINALATVDPKTGKTLAPQIAPAKSRPTEIHSAYGRGRSPPASRRRSPTPPSRRLSKPGEVEGTRQSTFASDATATLANAEDQTRPTGQQRPKRLLCRDWQSGACQYTADTCRFEHSYEGALGRQQKGVTCFYWNNGNACKKPADECEFAHVDTGVYAGPPGSYGRPTASVAAALHPGDLRITNEQRPSTGERTSESASRPNLNGTLSTALPNVTSPSEAVLDTSCGQPVSKKQTTCYYWRDGNRCKKPEVECQFAHRDTGFYAGKPGTYTRSVPTFSSLINSVGLPSASPKSPELGNTGPRSLLPQVSPSNHTEAGEYVQPSDSFNDAAPVEPVSNYIPSDPRLKGRTAPTTEQRIVASAQPQSPTEKPSMVHGAPAVSCADDSGPFMHGSTDADLEMAKRGISSLDSIQLLSIRSDKAIERVYIHMPSDRAKEVKLLVQYFTGLNCKVYTAQAASAWELFRKTFARHGALLVVHPSETFLGSLPGRHKLLVDSSLRVFSIGVQHSQCIEEDREPAYEARRLFPHGGMTFITDDVFVYYPEKATAIIERVLKETKFKPYGGEFYKIGGRPGVMDWMLRLAIQKCEEDLAKRKRPDQRWFDCYEALCRLCPEEDKDPRYPDRQVPLETSHLWSIDEDSLPSFKGRWESGDEEGATDCMANLFAGEACIRAWEFRKFYFIYQRPGAEKQVMSSQGHPVVEQEVDPKGWSKKYCQISVMTPEQEEESKKPKEKVKEKDK